MLRPENFYAPMLFMLLVFAYMNGIYSSREIEKACQNDIRFMWILQNSPAPDHATIAHFQNERLSGVMEKLFYQLVVKLSELCEVEFRNVFVDGKRQSYSKTDTEVTFMRTKEDYAFRRFLTGGKSKTEIRFLLLGFAFNIQKLFNRLNSERFHMPLFEKMIA